MRKITVEQMAADAGFEIAGVSAAIPLPDADVYLDWAARGLAGRMSYLTDGRAALRGDPRSLLPSARSMISVAKLYHRTGETDSPVSRYARGLDYHDVMRASLERLLKSMRARYGEFESKIAVDTAPLLERSYARRAGLGWIGRNTCLINQRLGSWLFLGEILTSLELEPGEPAPDRCGTCTRCIQACPTAALQPGGMRTELDATRCIAYLTIELKGDIPEDRRAGAGTHVFGCDICQEVCPWNRRAPHTADPAMASLLSGDALDEWAGLSPEQFRTLFRSTPVWRAKYRGFLRNVAVAMGNSGEARYRPALERLAESGDEIVASHAMWALQRLEDAR